MENTKYSRELADAIAREIAKKIEKHDALAEFAKNRAKFEGWLKVELLGILKNATNADVVPEKDWHDLVVNDKLAIELKTVSTNYKAPNVVEKTRPITDSKNAILTDIKKLRESKYPHKMVMFVAFPVPERCEKLWNRHVMEINKELRNPGEIRFKFKNGIPGKIHYGFVK